MSETPEFLPCPFCGKDDELKITHIYEGEAYIGCDRCKYDGVHIRVWNTRVYPEDVQKTIERDKPRNPVRPKGYSNIECPACGAHMKQFYEPEEANVPFCYNCGQRLDWGENES